ncbi:MAG TPA: hypothetical protein DCL21_05815 [Alphaproteobacteria bacterium]|nr:hypothetical protein [Alphaproteobacteria bacterium]
MDLSEYKAFINDNKENIDKVNVFATRNGSKLTAQAKISAYGKHFSCKPDINDSCDEQIFEHLVKPLLDKELLEKLSIATPDEDEFASNPSDLYRNLPSETAILLNRKVERYMLSA